MAAEPPAGPASHARRAPSCGTASLRATAHSDADRLPPPLRDRDRLRPRAARRARRRHPRVRLAARGRRPAGHDRATRSTSHGATSREIHQRVGDAVHGGSAIYQLDEDALEAADADLILTQELCAVCAVGYREVSEAVRALEMRLDGRLARADVGRGDPEHDRDGRRDGRRRGRRRRARREPPRAARRDRGEGPGAARGRVRRPAGRRARVARPAVRRRPLGARPDPAGRRLGPARPGRQPGPADDLGRGRRGRPRPAPPDALRLPPAARPSPSGRATPRPGLDRRPAGDPARPPDRARRLVVLLAARARGSSTGSRCWPRSSTPRRSATSRRATGWTPIA